MNELYNQWCKETKRGGAILIGGSIREFFTWLENKGYSTVKLSDYGILSGEDAIRFNKAIDDPKKVSAEEKARMKANFDKIMANSKFKHEH